MVLDAQRASRTWEARNNYPQNSGGFYLVKDSQSDTLALCVKKQRFCSRHDQPPEDTGGYKYTRLAGLDLGGFEYSFGREVQGEILSSFPATDVGRKSGVYDSRTGFSRIPVLPYMLVRHGQPDFNRQFVLTAEL